MDELSSFRRGAETRTPRAIAPENSRGEPSRRKILAMKRENPTIEICPESRAGRSHTATRCIRCSPHSQQGVACRRTHTQEQIVHILEGKMRLIVEGVPHELSAGDSFYLASNVPHGVETLSATRVLDTFSPPRTDYLAIDEKVLHGAL